MFSCRRNSNDALLNYLYEVRKLHLIPVAVGTSVGDVLIVKPGGDVWSVELNDLFEGAQQEDFRKDINAECAEVNQRLSGKFEAKNVIGVLAGIAASMGVAGSAKIAAAYGNARSLRVGARSVTSDTLSLGMVGRFFLNATMRPDQGVYHPNDELYMVREVLRSPAIEVVALDANDQILKIDAEATGLADAKLALSAQNEQTTTVTFSSAQPAAFAVRLIRIAQESDGWAIQGVEKAVVYRGGDGEAAAPGGFPDTLEAHDAIIGDQSDGPISLTPIKPPL